MTRDGDALDELLGSDTRLRRIERARAACGQFRSGDAGGTATVADVRDHDALLDDAFSA